MDPNPAAYSTQPAAARATAVIASIGMESIPSTVTPNKIRAARLWIAAAICNKGRRETLSAQIPAGTRRITFVAVVAAANNATRLALPPNSNVSHGSANPISPVLIVDVPNVVSILLPAGVAASGDQP
jgi:hypothetical protein